MIEELTPCRIVGQNGNVYGEAPCSVWEIMDKVNEIIRYLNAKEEEEK